MLQGGNPIGVVAKTDYALNEGVITTLPPIQGIGQDFQLDLTPGSKLSRVRARDVTDGLSKTYLVGERAMLRQNYESIKPDEPQQSIFIGGLDIFRAADKPPENDPNRAQWYIIIKPDGTVMDAGYPIQGLPFGSAHPSTWNAVLCDGSVHAMSYNISLATHQALSSRAAGDSPDPKQY